ncbi:MAG: hypothetical protein ACI865_000857 [Flavobacteriaceae bacterium]|jgi:hypothetical protein
MKKNPNNIQERLAKYSFLTAGILGATNADASVVYTDEAPDFNGVVGSQYFLDLNNDGTDDFRIWHNGSNNLYISPLGATNEVLGSGGATFAYPFALSSGAAISSGAGAFFNNGFAGGFQSLNYGSCSFGNWCNITDRYIGLRFDIGGSIHYGWVRLDVNNAGSIWTVKDYAYDNVVGVGISAGDMATIGTAVGPTVIQGTDIGDNNNGTDMLVDFVASVDETSLSEYRIIAVKESSLGTFDLLAAQTTPNYTAVTPVGSPTYVNVLAAADLDSDGDLITIAEPYRIVILGVADGVVAIVDILSMAASPVTLNITAAVASGITGTDVADNADGTDLQVDFNAAGAEVGIAEYRVIAVKTSVAGSFGIAAADGLNVPAYTAVVPTGGPYSMTLATGDTDSDGDLIGIGIDYTLFVLSVPDTIGTNVSDMAMAGTGVTLNVLADIASGIIGTDIGDNTNTPTDLQVDFAAATNENSVFAYRVIAVKASASAGFNLAAADALPVERFMPVSATGGPYAVIFHSSKFDSDGDAIVNDVPYSIFVMSFADGVTANASNMAQSAADVTLTFDTSELSENALDNLNIYANEDGIVINTPSALIGSNVQAVVTAMSGQQLAKASVNNPTTMIPVSSLSSGMYFVLLTDNAGNNRSIKVFLK